MSLAREAATRRRAYEQPERDRLTALVVDELSTRLAAFVREREFAFPQVAHVATGVA